MKNKLLFSVFVYFIILTLLSLGFWQIYRLNWKLDLIEQIENSLKNDPVELSNIEKKNYLRIKTSGEIDFDKQMYLYNLNDTGKPGFEVINPIKIGDVNYLLNRGWIPFEKKDLPEINLVDQNQIVGTLMLQTKASTFKPENDIEKNYWFTLNREDIFKFTGRNFSEYVIYLNGEFKISKSIAGRRLEQHEVKSLLQEKRIGPLDDFVAKTGRKFSAMLKLEDDFKVTFVFDKPDQEESDEKDLLVSAPEVASCPVCNSTVKQTELSYICTEHKKVSEGKCNFRITRKLLDKEIPLEELQKLVSEKKTGLIKGFVSRRTKRPFDANLILKDNGGIGFEFPPRPPKKKKKSA